MSGKNPPLIFQICVDNEGVPVSGGALYHYVTNTSIDKAIFADFELTTPLPQPLVADTEGRYPQYFLEDGQYTFVEFDAPGGNQLRAPAHHIEGAGPGDGYTLPVATDTVLGGVKEGAGVTIAPDGTLSTTFENVPGPDLVLLDPDTLVIKQASGVGADLLRVGTDFTWAGWAYGTTLGGRGIAPGYAWFGSPGSQVRRRVWCAADGVAMLRWTTDNWVSTIQDDSLFGIIGPGVLNVHPPCLKYLTIGGVACWVATCDSDGRWWYAQDIAANYNANGTLKTSAWVAGTPATRVMADIATDGTVSCMVGNHSRVIRTTNWGSWTDVLNTGGPVLGGIDTDRDGLWIAVERDTGKLWQSVDAGLTWTAPQIYTRSSETDPYIAAATIIPTGSVQCGNGVWLLTGAASYAYSTDGINWTIKASALGSFYGVGFDGVRFFATNPNNGTDPAVIYQLLVSEVPVLRHLVAEQGATVGGGLWLPDIPSASALGTDQNGKTYDIRISSQTPGSSGSTKVGHRNRTVDEALRDFGVRVNVQDFSGWRPGPSGTDNYAALQAAIDECPVGGVVEVPMPTPVSGILQPYRISQGLRIDKRMGFRGTGVGTTRELVRIQPAAGIPSIDYLLKVGHKPTTTNDLLVGGFLENITLYGGGAVINDALFVGLAAQEFHFFRTGFDSGRGRGIRLQCWWDSIWFRIFMENCNAGNFGTRLSDSMVYLDKGWSDIPGGEPAEFFNVNNLTVLASHFEQLNAAVFKGASGANVDGLWILDGTKFENNGMPGNVDETLFDFTGVTRAVVKDCTIHRINPSYGYKTILKTPSPGITEFKGNSLTEVTSSTVLADVSGTAVIDVSGNTSWNCSGVSPQLVNTSTRAIHFEYPRNGDIASGIGRNGEDRLRGPFVSMNSLPNASGWPFIADASGQEVASIEETVFTINGAATDITTINPYKIIQCPTAIRIGFRARTTSGSGTLDLVCPTGVSGERSFGEKTISSTYSVVSWIVSAGTLGLVNISRNIKLKTGAANAATIYIDGMFVESIGHSFDGGLNWNPASIANGANLESPDVTIPDAIVGDFVAVHPPESYVIPAGVLISARVTAAATCRIQVFNFSGGAVDLADGLWFVRLYKTGYART